MAVVTVKTDSITNRDATPRVMNNPASVKGNIQGFVGTVECSATDDIGSTYIFGMVPSNAVMHSLRLYSDDIGAAAAAMDFGLYRTTADGGAVVDADFFASAVSLKDGALNGEDILHESAVIDLNEQDGPIWTLLGLSTDPCLWYDVVGTATGALDAAATISLKGTYAI
jgi:hypothetical protein